MSDFQRDFLRAKLARLPSMPPPPTPLQELSRITEDDEYDYEAIDEFPDSSSVSSASSTSTIRAPYQLSPPSPRYIVPTPGRSYLHKVVSMPLANALLEGPKLPHHTRPYRGKRTFLATSTSHPVTPLPQYSPHI